MKNVDIVIKIGAKEIVALCVGIPMMYKKLRDVKLKYDLKERENSDTSEPIIFSDVIIDQNGIKWRKEV